MTGSPPRLQEFLAKDSLEDLVSILSKASVANRLVDFAPPNKRAPHDFHMTLRVGRRRGGSASGGRGGVRVLELGILALHVGACCGPSSE